MSSWEDLGRLAYRPQAVVGWLMELLEVGPEEGVPMVALVAQVGELAGDRWAWATIEATVRDMAHCGIVAISGKPGYGRRPDGRRVRVTVLGWAWWEGRILPVPLLEADAG